MVPRILEALYFPRHRSPLATSSLLHTTPFFPLLHLTIPRSSQSLSAYINPSIDSNATSLCKYDLSTLSISLSPSSAQKTRCLTVFPRVACLCFPTHHLRLLPPTVWLYVGPGSSDCVCSFPSNSNQTLSGPIRGGTCCLSFPGPHLPRQSPSLPSYFPSFLFSSPNTRWYFSFLPRQSSLSYLSCRARPFPTLSIFISKPSHASFIFPEFRCDSTCRSRTSQNHWFPSSSPSRSTWALDFIHLHCLPIPESNHFPETPERYSHVFRRR